MSGWAEPTIDPTQALLDAVNKGKQSVVTMEGVEVAVGDYAAPCLVVFSRPISEVERDSLKVSIKALADGIEPGLVVDLQLGRHEEPAKTGVKASQPVGDYVWMAYCQMRLRLDEVKKPLLE